MALVEVRHHFRVNYESILDKKIGNERTDELAIVINFVLPLLLAMHSVIAKLYHQCSFIKLLIKSGIQGDGHFHRRTNDDLGEVCIFSFHEGFLTTDDTDEHG